MCTFGHSIYNFEKLESLCIIISSVYDNVPGDFKIVCDSPMTDFVPQPEVPKEIGWGPSRASDDGGLLAPSHEGGIIFYRPKETHVIKFIVTKRFNVRYWYRSIYWHCTEK